MGSLMQRSWMSLNQYDCRSVLLKVISELKTNPWKFGQKQFTVKGQIKSECIYEIIDFPKYHRKNLIDFCPGRFYRLGTCDLFWLFSRRLYSGECITYLVWINFQGRNLSNFFGGILENQWFHKYILTSSDL